MEKDLEAWTGREVRRRGGLWLKWVSPGCSGVPDRILIAPGGKVAFVEMKQKGGKVSQRQRYVLSLLTRMGCQAYVVFTKEEVRGMLQEVMGDAVHPTRVSEGGH